MFNFRLWIIWQSPVKATVWLRSGSNSRKPKFVSVDSLVFVPVFRAFWTGGASLQPSQWKVYLFKSFKLRFTDGRTREDTKYIFRANLWYFLALSNLWNKWVSWYLYWSKEGAPGPLWHTTLKRHVEQLLFADLNLILFQQKRNEVLNEIISTNKEQQYNNIVTKNLNNITFI